MNVKAYEKYLTSELLMGPSCLRILKELLDRSPLSLSPDQAVLDLGCGKGLTSLAIAKEIGGRVYANDLWVEPEENAKRFAEWGVDKQILPMHENANDLTLAKEQLDALISIDAYHYFGTGKGFFKEKILPFLKKGATVLIGVPGIKNEFDGRAEELLCDWLGNTSYMFRSPNEWKQIIGTHEQIDSAEVWEMDCFSHAWQEWFDTKHMYAVGDKQFFDTLIKPYTCFVGICIKLK